MRSRAPNARGDARPRRTRLASGRPGCPAGGRAPAGRLARRARVARERADATWRERAPARRRETSVKMLIRQGDDSDLGRIFTVVNDAAQAYRGVIPADRWHEPYM